MKLRIVGPNQTEITVGDKVVLFSYETPVAAHVQGRGYIRTAKHYSQTTSRHINSWLVGANAVVVPQSEIDGLIS